MSTDPLQRYIMGLPIGTKNWALAAETEAVDGVDLDELPEGVVTGSNLIQFSDEVPPSLRSAVALSLLAAQRVAANDPVARSPEDWIDRHNTVLKNLNWLVERGDVTDSEFSDLSVAVHKAIIPWLTVALGPAATAASLIVGALNQLQEMDKDQSWITLFERESRRFEVTEFQFSYVANEGADTLLTMAAARLDASFGRTQVLFIKTSSGSARFQGSSTTMRAPSELLTSMNGALKAKLAEQSADYIRALEV